MNNGKKPIEHSAVAFSPFARRAEQIAMEVRRTPFANRQNDLLVFADIRWHDRLPWPVASKACIGRTACKLIECQFPLAVIDDDYVVRICAVRFDQMSQHRYAARRRIHGDASSAEVPWPRNIVCANRVDRFQAALIDGANGDQRFGFADTCEKSLGRDNAKLDFTSRQMLARIAPMNIGDTDFQLDALIGKPPHRPREKKPR